MCEGLDLSLRIYYINQGMDVDININITYPVKVGVRILAVKFGLQGA